MTDWYKTGCVCGPSESTSRINNSISGYIARDVSSGEIDQVIGWLSDIRKDCDFKIARLESVKRERERVAAWRRNLNATARQFLDPDNLHLDLKTRQAIIQQRLGCEWHVAKALAEIVNKWAKRKIKENRNHLICMRVDAGTTITDVAREFKISRQQVHNILRERPDHKFI